MLVTWATDRMSIIIMIAVTRTLAGVAANEGAFVLENPVGLIGDEFFVGTAAEGAVAANHGVRAGL